MSEPDRHPPGKLRGRYAPLGAKKPSHLLLRQAIMVGPEDPGSIWRVTVENGSWYEVKFLDLPHVVVELLQNGLTIESVARTGRKPDAVPGTVPLTTLSEVPL
jgi:hypothetical protein